MSAKSNVASRNPGKMNADANRFPTAFPGLLALALLASSAFAAGPANSARPSPADKARVAAEYGKIPLSFEHNHGQSDPRVQFFSRGVGYGLFLAPDEAVLELKKDHKQLSPTTPRVSETAVLRMKLLGANRDAIATGTERLPGNSNYFIGNSSSQWAKDVPNFQRVSFSAVYPGIDLIYYGNQSQLEYDFVVAPNADPAKIALSFNGATPHIDTAGDLILSGKGHQTSFHAPVVYQLAGKDRIPVTGAYALKDGRVTFTLGAYDRSKALVIDPVLTYATFLGGSQLDEGMGIGTDSAGNTYIGGDTESYDFPVLNALKGTNTGVSNGYNLFVTKLNPAGTAILYSTYLGSIYDTDGGNIAVDSTGSVYIVGYTSAGDYPVTAGAFQTICGANYNNNNGVHSRANGCSPSSGNTSGVLTKLSPTGNSLVYSTFFGGDYFNAITAVAVNQAGEAYVTGNTNASCSAGPYYPNGEDSWDCFPTTSGAYQAEINGAFKPGSGATFGFFAKFTADGSSLVYSTLFAAPIGSAPSGGGLANTTDAVAVDAAGDGYIVGNGGYGLPTTAGAYFVPPVNTSQALPPYPAYVAKFDPTKSGSASLVYSTFLGSSAQASNYSSTATGVVVDASGDAIVAGYTNACGYPTTAGSFEPTTGSAPVCQDSFITKLNPTGTGLVWSTFYGSSPTTSSIANTQIFGLAQGATGNIYVTGTFNTNGHANQVPMVNPIEPVIGGGAFIAEFDSTGSNLLFASPLSGNSGADSGKAVAVDASGNMYLTGRVDSATPTIPITAGAVQKTYGGGFYDAYAVKIAPFSNSAVTLALSAASVNAGTTATFTATVTGPSGSPIPTGTVTFLNGSASLGTGMLDATGKAVFTNSTLAVGTYSVTASYGGDTIYSTSVSTPAQALAVVANSTTTTLTSSANSVLTGTSLTFTASVAPTASTLTPTGSVIFKDGSTTLSTVALSGGKAMLSTSALAVGAHSITASYGGDSNDVASASTVLSITITAPPADFALSFNQTGGTITAGSSLTVVITETPANGFAAPTTFSCGTLPSYTTCTFTPSSLTPNGTTAVSTTLVIATNVAVARLDAPLLPGSEGHGMNLVLATILLLPLAGFRNRKLHPSLGRVTMMALIAVFASIVFTGCSGNGTPKAITPSGSYPIVVTATSGTIVHSATYNVTVQ
jgi:hypothetical protein